MKYGVSKCLVDYGVFFLGSCDVILCEMCRCLMSIGICFYL